MLCGRAGGGLAGPKRARAFAGGEASAHLVGVDGHARGQAHHGDAVEARRVGHGRRRQVVVGLRRVAHQDGVHLKRSSITWVCVILPRCVSVLVVHARLEWVRTNACLLHA